jgi:biopolymer transport protein TolR
MTFDQQDQDSISQINITPLVDVMLVLLIIFMVTAPILQQGIHVDLPEVTAAPLEGSEEQLIVIIARDGKLQMNDTPMKVDELNRKLSAILKAKPDRQVYLRADKNVPYGKVVEVMAAVRAAGVRKLGMVTEPLKDER